MNELDLKYKIPQQGEYNELIYQCKDCDYTTFDDEDKDTSNYALGWFKLLDEWCMVWECPKCFTKWFHHDRDLHYHRHYRIREDIAQRKINP